MQAKNSPGQPAVQNKLIESAVTIYSHGFGENSKRNMASYFSMTNKVSVPEYPDAPGVISRACFYTQPAVLVLAKDLKKYAVSEKYKRIHLVGRSCGGGTAMTCLAKLLTYDPSYFQGTDISETDATAIIAAINRGSLSLTAPLLHLTDAKAVAVPGTVLTAATVIGACILAYHINKRTYNFPYISKLNTTGLCVAGIGAQALWGINSGAQSINYCSVPSVTNMHYDPLHPTPLNSLHHLKGKLTCPMLFHFNKDDGVLKNPDHNTVYLYEEIKNDKTHIIITDDASHNETSNQHLNALNAFQQKYIFKNTNADEKQDPLQDPLYADPQKRDTRDLKKW